MRGSYGLHRSIRTLVSVGLATATIGMVAAFVTAKQANAEPPEQTTATSDSTSTTAAKPTRSSYKPYFVEFRARSAATYGHMYVFYGQVNGRGEITKSDIAGLHPSGDANDCENCSVVSWTLGHIIFVPAEVGASDGDLEEKYVTARYRVMVDAATYKKVSAHVARLKTEKPMWNALMRNCVSFGNGVAEHMGLKIPTFLWMQPKDYVEALRDLNGGKPQGPLRFAAPGSASAQPEKPEPAAAPPAAPSKPKKQPAMNAPSAALGAAAPSGTR